MSYDDPNVYYNPEKFDLEQIGMLYDPESCYSFDDLVVWKHTDGRIFWASDSGCSCPTPFENMTLEDLQLVTAATWNEFQDRVENHCVPRSYNYDTGEYGPAPDPQAPDKTDLLAKVSALI